MTTTTDEQAIASRHPLPQWETDKAEICERIEANATPFKIVTKVKNDAFFLRRWIEHHSRIVGLENLLVLDNLSTQPEMFEVYEQYGDALFAFQFSAFHNRVHRVHEFPELYAALRASCGHYQVLDADEYLTYVNDDLTHYSDRRIVAKLEHIDLAIVPGVWLENVLGYRDRFHLSRENHLKLNMSHGKPIIAAKTNVAGMINHNFQIAEDLYEGFLANFFVLHLLRLSPRQRIRANMNKLIANKIIDAEMPLEQVLKLDPDIIKANNNNPRQWLREILFLIDKPETSPVGAGLGPGEALFRDDGSIEFSESWQADALRRFLSNPDACRTRIFGKKSDTSPKP